MSYGLTEELHILRQEIRRFLDERIIPAESEIIQQDREGNYETLNRLQAEAKEAGLWTPHLPKELGGLGLGIMGMCALFREMGRSPVGARVFNSDAPDQGNMDLLVNTASPELRDRYLKPLCDAQITSAFCMTEPSPGAGSDPQNLRTSAVQDSNGDWVINGRKWYSTGGGRAAFLILMARTSDDPRTGCTMFIVDRKAAGVEHVRDFGVMADPLLTHREAELTFTDVRVSPQSMLGELGEGFFLAQKRLVPARVTHCMRWLGLADRALELCKAYISERKSFGKSLSEHQLIQKKIADNAIAIHAGNLMTLHCASILAKEGGKVARPYASMCKNHVAQLLCQVLDDAIQMHGGLGYSNDMPFAYWYRYARSARIVDGADEIHTTVIARDYMKGRVDLLV
jgi:acyl-CoA dehydrogenase